MNMQNLLAEVEVFDCTDIITEHDKSYMQDEEKWIVENRIAKCVDPADWTISNHAKSG